MGGIAWHRQAYQYSGGGGAGGSTLLTGLVSYWKMDEVSNGSVPVPRADSFGANTLTDNNTVASAVGIISNAALFTLGNTESLSLASLSLTAPYSVSFWVSPNAIIATNQGCFESSTLFMFLQGTTGKMVLQNTGSFATVAAVGTGAFHHIVCVLNGASSAIYLDNVKATGTVSGNSSGATRIGSTSGGGGEFLDGKIDEFGLWSRALSDADVLALYNGGAGLTYPF